MITINNYFEKKEHLPLAQMPEALKKGHDFLNRATQEGENLASYQNSEVVKKTVDLYLQKLNEFLSKAQKPAKRETAAKKQASQKEAKKRPPGKRAEISKPSVPGPLWVERTPEELRFIKRFVNLNGKTKTKEDMLRFINSLQKAIVEKRIRKTSPYAQEVKYVQERLIQVYNSMATKIKLELKPETLEKLKALTGSEKVMASIGFIKRYIAMNGKAGMKEKAQNLFVQIDRAYEKGKIGDSDPYKAQIHEIKSNLKAFIADKTIKTLQIEPATLNGLEGLLGCACEGLNGVASKPSIMNSMDFANLAFATLGFKGKWLQLIGDPSANFTAMVYGKPKMGKSYLCIDFAGYLARHHGRALYVAKEEGLDMTLQKKLTEKEVAHPNLFVSAVLPENLSAYDFIFLDSVNKLGLQPEDLNLLKTRHPSKSFIFIFQSTKEGNFRGANSFQHDVDIVIEVPQRGRAVQFGRFNQGGEIDIFNE